MTSINDISGANWLLILTIVAVLFPTNIATHSLVYLNWYQRKFPLVGISTTSRREGKTYIGIDGSRSYTSSFYGFLHWLYFNGWGECATLMFFAVGLYFYIFYNWNAKYQVPVNGLTVVFIALVRFFPWVMSQTESRHMREAVSVTPPAAPLAAQKPSYITETAIGYMTSWPIWWLLVHTTVTSVVILIVAALVSSDPDVGNNHTTYIPVIFYWITFVFSVFGIVLAYDLVYAKPKEGLMENMFLATPVIQKQV